MSFQPPKCQTQAAHALQIWHFMQGVWTFCVRVLNQIYFQATLCKCHPFYHGPSLQEGLWARATIFVGFCKLWVFLFYRKDLLYYWDNSNFFKCFIFISVHVLMYRGNTLHFVLRFTFHFILIEPRPWCFIICLLKQILAEGWIVDRKGRWCLSSGDTWCLLSGV